MFPVSWFCVPMKHRPNWRYDIFTWLAHVWLGVGRWRVAVAVGSSCWTLCDFCLWPYSRQLFHVADVVAVAVEAVKEGREAQRASRRGSYSCFFWPRSHVESAHEIHQTGQEVFRRSIRTKVLDVWRSQHSPVYSSLVIFFPCILSSVHRQELSYRKQIARQLHTQFVEGISVTLKSTLRATQGHWKRNHWTDHTRLTISRVNFFT